MVYVSVNAVRHTRNILVLPDRLVPEWTQADFATSICRLRIPGRAG